MLEVYSLPQFDHSASSRAVEANFAIEFGPEDATEPVQKKGEESSLRHSKAY